MNEWKLYGFGKSTHPLHLNVHHRQIVSATCVAGSADCDQALLDDWVTPGEWRNIFLRLKRNLQCDFAPPISRAEHRLAAWQLYDEDLGVTDNQLIDVTVSSAGKLGHVLAGTVVTYTAVFEKFAAAKSVSDVAGNASTLAQVAAEFGETPSVMTAPVILYTYIYIMNELEILRVLHPPQFFVISATCISLSIILYFSILHLRMFHGE